MQRAFSEFITIPEETGIIMVIEKEFGPSAAEDWSRLTAGLADIVKCTFGTAALYDQQILKQKTQIYKNAGISPMIGGTLTEIAILCAGGYSKIHIQDYLQYAKSSGFTVISEVGKKDPKKDTQITPEKRIELMKKDLESGSAMVIIEAREGGTGIGVMDKNGKVDFAELDVLIDAVGLANTIIEAPNKSQQQTIFMRYGPKANIGNVQPRDIMSAAALRAGLRGDTIGALRKEDWKKYHDSQNAPDDYKV